MCSSDREQHLAATPAPCGVGDRFAVIRELVGRLDGGRERAVREQGGELAVNLGTVSGVVCSQRFTQ
jgi:hypothetical protein